MKPLNYFIVICRLVYIHWAIWSPSPLICDLDMSFIYILVAVSSVLVKDFLLCIGVNFKSVNAGFEPRMDFMQLEYWLHSAICTGGMCVFTFLINMEVTSFTMRLLFISDFFFILTVYTRQYTLCITWSVAHVRCGYWLTWWDSHQLC